MRQARYEIPKAIRDKRAREEAANGGQTRVESGRGVCDNGSLNLFDVKGCVPNCGLKGSNSSKFECEKHNSHATVVVKGGLSRTTVNEFSKLAPCIRPSSRRSSFSHRLPQR